MKAKHFKEVLKLMSKFIKEAESLEVKCVICNSVMMWLFFLIEKKKNKKKSNEKRMKGREGNKEEGMWKLFFK